MRSCASGWRAWRTDRYMERSAMKLLGDGTLNSSVSSLSAAGLAIRLWMANCGKWHAMHMSTGKEVWVREIAGEVDVADGRARIAAHARARRKHEVVTFPAHHQGIPLGARRADGKIVVHIRQGAPLVEKRSLLADVGAAAGGGGWRVRWSG